VKILQICNKFPYPPKDGGVIATYNMLKGFYITGHAVTIATINTSKHYTDKASLPFEIGQMANYYDMYKYTNPHVFGALWNLLFSNKPYTATRFMSKKFKKVLDEIFISNTFDIIQIEGLYMCQYIPYIRKYSNAPIAYRAHNIEFEIWERLWKKTKNPIKKAYFFSVAKRVARFEKSYINVYDILVPITQRDLNKYKELGNTKPSFVAPTGVFVKDYQSKPFSGDISLFHIGGLDWAPNQYGLLWFIKNCWEDIRKLHPHISFKIAGRNAPKWFVKKMSAPGVEFVGEVESSRDFMTNHAIMVVPLLAGGGMRIKIIEGLAYGKVIISTSVGAEGISAQHEKEIYIANTTEQFVAGITELINNSELFRSIEKNAITFVHQTYDNNKIIQELIDFYQQHVPRN